MSTSKYARRTSFAHLRDRRGHLGLAGADRRLADGDASRALAAELERHSEAEGLLGRLLLDLDRGLRIQPLAGDVEARGVDSAAQARGRDGGIRGQRPLDGGLEREGAFRRLRRGGDGEAEGQGETAHEPPARGRRHTANHTRNQL